MSNSTCLLANPQGKDLSSLLSFYGFDIALKPESLYEILYKNLGIKNLKEGYGFKIPPISHHIWLTNFKKPKEVRDSDIENLKNTISIIDNGNHTNWQHFFWTNCQPCIPQTIQKLKPLNIIVRNIDEVEGQLITYKIVATLVHEKKFGMAVDLLREDLVNVFGGFYTDLNYVVNTSPESLLKKLNFFADAPMQLSIENYMFASSPNHPILVYAIDTTLNLINNPSMLGIDLSGCDSDDLTHSLSFGPFTFAFIKYANKYGTIDLAIPPRELEGDDSIEETHIRHNPDGTVTTTYVYKTCPLEQKKGADLELLAEKFTEYAINHGVCTDLYIGEDGENGGTWEGNYEMQINGINNAAPLVEKSGSEHISSDLVL